MRPCMKIVGLFCLLRSWRRPPARPPSDHPFAAALDRAYAGAAGKYGSPAPLSLASRTAR